eukprot:4396234-Karenia_brevis.AAC.1
MGRRDNHLHWWLWGCTQFWPQAKKVRLGMDHQLLRWEYGLQPCGLSWGVWHHGWQTDCPQGRNDSSH